MPSDYHQCEAVEAEFAWFTQQCIRQAVRQVRVPDTYVGEDGWVWTCDEHDFTKVSA